MHYYLYETKNNINGKIYVGVHKTKVLDDGYMGSGKVIKRAIEKHGLENFSKTILQFFETEEAMFARETEVVDDDFLAREDTYNLRRGGMGGWDYLNKNGLSVLLKEQFSRDPTLVRKAALLGNKAKNEKAEKDPEYKKYLKEIALHGLSVSRQKYPKGTFFGKSHTDDHKKYMSNIMSIKSSGEKNSQFGTMWITNGIENKKIKKNEVIPDGWNKGRKCG